MASASPLAPIRDFTDLTEAPGTQHRPARRWTGATSALVALGGTVLAVVGGGLRPGAFNLFPYEDGLFTAGLVAVLLAFGHGLRERLALLAAAPIVAVSCLGMHKHHFPLALVGAEIALVGVVGFVFELGRARWRAAR